jgi:hypothetical protein
MTEIISREIHLRRRPVGLPTEATFELVETTVPEPADGEILVRNIWMSVDPYMRGRMIDRKSYTPPFEVGKVLQGGCIGRVIASKHGKFAVGDCVSGMFGWREVWTSDGKGVIKIDPTAAPLQTYLGTLGMPGLTAYVGLLKIGGLKGDETVFVSAAAGAVGSVACQIARIKGCRVVGSAGSDEKVAWLRDEAGVDHAFNYKTVDDIGRELGRACPDGIDLYYDNVGGRHLEAALLRMRDFGRVVACGMIDQYNATAPPPGPSTIIATVFKRLRIQGFIVTDHFDMLGEFHTAMAGWIADNKIKWRETVVEGIENAPKAFLGLFSGSNLGKMLVQVGPD